MSVVQVAIEGVVEVHPCVMGSISHPVQVSGSVLTETNELVVSCLTRLSRLLLDGVEVWSQVDSSFVRGNTEPGEGGEGERGQTPCTFSLTIDVSRCL